MGRRDEKYYFVFDDKILQYDSILQLRTEVPEDEWQKIVNDTVGYYIKMKSVADSESVPMEKKDRRLMKKIERTVEFFKKLDPIRIQELNPDKMLEDTMRLMKAIDEQYEEDVKIVIEKQNSVSGDSDIRVSQI